MIKKYDCFVKLVKVNEEMRLCNDTSTNRTSNKLLGKFIEDKDTKNVSS